MESEHSPYFRQQLLIQEKEKLSTTNLSNPTSLKQTARTNTISTLAMTKYLPRQTKTWGGLSYLPHGLQTNTQIDILQTLLHTDELNWQFRPNTGCYNYQLQQTTTKTSTAFWQATFFTDQQTTTWHCQLQKTNCKLPYMKLLPKAHKLTDTASPTNLNKLTVQPVITAHSWTTSNPSRLLGTLNLTKLFYDWKTFWKNETYVIH